MEQSIHNCLQLKAGLLPNPTNQILRFVVPRVREHVAERLVLDAVEAWDLVNAELKHQGRRPLAASDKDYRHLKRIRNKLVAHRAENLVKTSRHRTWYQRNYDYDRVLALVRRVAQRVCSKVNGLVNERRMPRRPMRTTRVPEFGREDVAALVKAMKAHGIY
jgi:hypothetical protein